MTIDEALALARGALADIAHSDDMTLVIARRKAARIYAETAAIDLSQALTVTDAHEHVHTYVRQEPAP